MVPGLGAKNPARPENIPPDDRLSRQAQGPARVPHRRVRRGQHWAQGAGAAARRGFRADRQQRHLRRGRRAMSYWEFFPAEDGWGRVPMWGFAEVEERGQGGRAGDSDLRVPPSSSHVVVPTLAATSAASSTASAHRATLPSAYHRYLATERDHFYRPESEEVQMLLRPLFFTSFRSTTSSRTRGCGARADRDLQRLEQDGAGRRLSAGPAPGS